MPFTQQEKELFTRNVEYYLQQLPKTNSEIKNELIELTIDNKFNIDNLKIKDLNEEELEEIKKVIKKSIRNLFSDLLFYDSDELQITLKDYVEFILESK